MGRPSISDADDDFLDLPGGLEPDDDGTVGVDDSEDLLFQDLGDESEDVGLDTEAAGSTDALTALLLDIDAEESGEALDDTPLEVDDDIDSDGDEEGWTKDSEGATSENWDDALPDELSDEIGDDGGEEGVDDPLLDGLPEDLHRPLAEDDDDEEEGIENDGLDELASEMGTDA